MSFSPKGSSQQEADEASPDDDDDNQPAGESRGGTGGENAVAIKLVILILYKLQTILEPPTEENFQELCVCSIK